MNQNVMDMAEVCTFPACQCKVPDYAFSAHNRVKYCEKLAELRKPKEKAMEYSTYNVHFLDFNHPPTIQCTFWCDAASEEHAIEQWEAEHSGCELIDVTRFNLLEE